MYIYSLMLRRQLLLTDKSYIGSERSNVCMFSLCLLSSTTLKADKITLDPFLIELLFRCLQTYSVFDYLNIVSEAYCALLLLMQKCFRHFLFLLLTSDTWRRMTIQMAIVALKISLMCEQDQRLMSFSHEFWSLPIDFLLATFPSVISVSISYFLPLIRPMCTKKGFPILNDL